MNSIFDQLSKLIESGLLPHSLLFSGQDEDCLLEQARLTARKILQTGELDKHSDFIYTDSSSISDLRRLLTVLSLKAFDRRVVILDKAEKLSHQAVNSLLKRLEEPDKQTFFIVLTTHESKLLPTLRSRLTIFRQRIQTNINHNALAEFFLSNALPVRVNAMKKIDPHKENINAFLSFLYQNQINNLNSEAIRRLPLILETFGLLGANVQATKALQWLAVRW